jgi:two-component system, cell cycle response regulator CtrA
VSDEIETLREEVRQLKSALGRDGWQWPLSWRLSRKQTILLNLLARRDRVNKQALVAAIDDGRELSNPAKNLEVHVWHLRRKLKPVGITINTSVGLGYWLSVEDRARLRAIAAAEASE